MKIITRGEAMRIHRQHPASRLFPFCTGKYRWHGSAEAYTGREVRKGWTADCAGGGSHRGLFLHGRRLDGVMGYSPECRWFFCHHDAVFTGCQHDTGRSGPDAGPEGKNTGLPRNG